MALAYRTPTEYLINQLPSRLTDNISVKQVDIIQEEEEFYGSFLNFNLSKEQRKFFVEKGVYLSPFSWKHHSHPACKTIENWLLFKEIGCHAKHVSKTSSIAFVSLREGKLNALKKIMFEKKMEKKTCEKISAFNRFYSTKDKLRYKEDGGKELIYKSFEKIKSVVGTDASYYIHDECHYWTPEDLSNFLIKTEANSILATIIHPTEIDVGKDCSHLPFLYQFEIHENSVFFFPDGNRSEGYEQPKTAGWWLKLRRFYCNGEVYSLTLLRSIGPFHLIYLSKGSLAVESKRFFDDFNILDLPVKFKANNLVGKANVILRTGFLIKIVSYIKSLKKPDRESAIAKLRMMSDDDFSIDEMMFVEGLVQTLLSDSYRSIWESGWTNWITSGLKDTIPDPLHSAIFRSHFKAKENLEFLINLKSLSITFETKDFYSRSNFNLIDEIKEHFQYENNVVNKDNIWKIIRSSYRGSYVFDEDTSGYETIKNKNNDLILHGPCSFFRLKKKKEYVTLSAIEKNSNEDELNKLMAEKKFFFKNNIKRFTEACKSSYTKLGELMDDYHFILKKELPINSIFCRMNYKIVAIKKNSLNKMGLIFYLHHGLYNQNKMIENEERSEFSDYSNSKKKKERLDEIYKELGNGDSINEKVSNSCALNVKESAKCTENRMAESNPIDEKIFCNLKNKCCFDSVMKCLAINFDILLDKIKNSYLLQKLIEDDGLSHSELLDLCDVLNLNANIINENGTTIKYYEESPFSLILSRKHCKAVETNEVKNWLNTDAEFFFINLPGINNLTKDIFDYKRSKKLFESLSKGLSGVLFHSIKDKNDKSEKKKDKNRTIEMMNLFFEDENESSWFLGKRNEPIYGFFGFAGSGKSKGIQDFINQNYEDKCATIISPRNELLKDWESKITLNSKKIRFVTYEKALTISYFEDELIVVDEIGLLPPGYISLLSLITTFRIEKISHNFRLSKRNYKTFVEKQSGRLVLLGDHLQGRYYNEFDCRSLSQPDEVDYIMMNEEVVYLNYSHRMCKGHFYKPNVEMLGNGKAKESRRFQNVYVSKKAIPNAQLLVASRDEQIRFKDMGAKTFGEAQGLTFDEVILVLSPPSMNCSVNMWNVAMTRAREGIHFALNGIDTVDDFLNRMKGTPIAAMILGIQFDIHNTPGLNEKKFSQLIKVDKLGMSQEDIEIKLIGDPYLKSIIDSIDEGLSVEQEYDDILCENPVPKVHLPIESIHEHVCFISSNLKERKERELIGDECISEQFPDFWKKGEPGYILSQSERFQSIFPKHSNSDSLTFLAAVKKRLRFSNPSIEREKFEKVRHLGSEMLDLFLDKVPICNKIDNNMMQTSINEYVQKKTSKTANTIASHSSRSEPDWKINEVFLFMKTQLCTKYEKRFSDAKAGQTLACFSHVVLNRFAAPSRYIEKKISRYLPDKFYIHQKKNFDCLNEWVIKNNFSNECLESDYEAFDSSQDCLILAFEYELLKYLGWGQEILDDYLELKFNLGCRLGNLAVMRFTGEFGTFLFNTLANMVFTFMSYELDGSESICFAGDDMCCNRGIKKRSDDRYDHILKRLTLRAKANITREPSFCGWRLTKYGIFKKPELVLERFLIAIEKGRLSDVIDSYYIECSYAYNLGERLYECFSEKDFVAHYCCIKIVHKNRGLLKGLSLEKFKESSKFGYSCKSLKTTSSSTNLTMVKETLNVSTSRVCMLMEGTHKMRELVPFRNLKILYQSNTSALHQESYESYQLLIRSASSMRDAKEIIKKSILVPLLLVYTNLDTMNVNHQEENVYSLMEEESQTVGLLNHLTLIYQEVLPTLYYCQMLCLTSMMTYLTKLVSSSLFLKMCTIKLDQTHLQLKLVLFIECQMCLTAYTSLGCLGERELLVVSTKKFLELNYLMMKRKNYLLLKCQMQKRKDGFLILFKKGISKFTKVIEARLGHGRRGGQLTLGGTAYPEMTLHQLRLQINVTNLGQARAVLMKESLLRRFWIIRLGLPVDHKGKATSSARFARMAMEANVAVQNWINLTAGFPGVAYGVRIRKLRRRTLLRQHWVMVMKEYAGELGHADDPQNFTPAEVAIYNNIMNDYAAYAFGIMAEEGFSAATQYSQVNTEYTIDYGAPVGEINVEFNPAEVARVFKYYAQSSDNPVLMNMTWRQIGECFAEDIVRYFKELQRDAQSWLVKANPVLAGNAPWVALDVTDGLEIMKLSPEEKKVIARAKNHLLKTMSIKTRDSISAEALLES